MSHAIEITPCGPLQATIRPPGSKSITNRALVCAALAAGRSQLTGALDSDDTRLMVAALEKLGIGVRADFDQGTIDIDGCGGKIPVDQAELFIGNSGTTVRFLAAVAALGQGEFRLDGTPRMRQRPIEDLLEGLRQLGADCRSEAGTGCPPIVIRAAGLSGGQATVRGDLSSQFLSGLLMACPYAAQPVELTVTGVLVSQPYVQMTLAVMRAFGVEVRVEEVVVEGDMGQLRLPVGTPDDQAPSSGGMGQLRLPVAGATADSASATKSLSESRTPPHPAAAPPPVDWLRPAGRQLSPARGEGIRIGPNCHPRFIIPNDRGYQPCRYSIEPDASAASYFFGAAAIAGGEVTVTGLSRESLQGDVAFVDVLERMGCQVDWRPDRITVRGRPLTGVDVDMNAISDTVQTLAAVALYAQGPTRITGVAHIRHKETDRIAALATELRKLGAVVEERPDGLTIEPAALRGAAIDTYDDHRMAMSLALVGLRTPGVIIHDPGCTAKTYPRFFDDLKAVCGG